MADEIETDIQATYGQFESIVTTGEIASDTIRVEEIESERSITTELRVDQLTNRSGLGTVTHTDTGSIVSGIVTATTFSGDVIGNVTGNLTGNVNATTGISTFSNIKITGKLTDGDDATGSAGQVLSSDGTDLQWINTSAANVASATSIGVNDSSNSTDTMYPTFVDTTSGNEVIRVDIDLKYKPSTGSFLGITSFTGVHLLDDNKIKFGDANDLEVYYTDGTGSDGGSVFKHTGPHDMRFQVPSGAHDIVFETTSGDNIAVYNANGSCEHYWRGASGAGRKIQTASTGIDVTGTVIDDGATHDGDVTFTGDSSDLQWDKSADALEFKDETQARFGNGNDLKISHTRDLDGQNDSNGDSVLDGTDWCSYIEETGTGPLIFKSNGGPSTGAFQWYDTSWRPILKLYSGTSARAALHHAGVEKLITATTGVEVTGGVKCTSTTNAFYPPRVTTIQRDAMTVTEGAMVYNTQTNKLNFYNGSGWEAVTSA